MSRRAATAVVVAAALVALAGALWLLRSRPAATATLPAFAPSPPIEPQSPPEIWPATLWLPAERGLLAPRAVEISSAPELKLRLAALVAALLAAPADERSTALFPVEVGVGALLLTADGTLYVDLRAADGAPPPGAGSTLEAQRVYSLVHTVMRNEPRIASVVLLWNGVQRESLAGHLDTRRPLRLRPELEAR